MTDILTQLESAIATQLAPLKSYGLDVLNSPHRCGGGARAVALFYFTDETAQGSNNGCSSTNELTLKVEVQACDQRSHHIAYPYIQAVKISLKNFAPGIGGADRFKYVSTRYLPFEDKNGMKWLYDMTFTLQLMECDVYDVPSAIADLFS